MLYYFRFYLGKLVKLYWCMTDILIYFENNITDKNVFWIQPFISFGKFHSHKMKWTNRKSIFTLFPNDIQLYSNSLFKLQNKIKKQQRPKQFLKPIQL